MRRSTYEPNAVRAAFTLIELLVVIVVLGILMAVAVPTFLRQQSKAQDSRTQQYLTTAYKAIRSGTPDTGNQYPPSTSMVSWVQQSEPELTVQRSSCYTGTATAPTDAVLVDPSSSANSLLLCARSASGNVWELSATATSAPSLINGTLVPLTLSGNEITDATRAADVQGDGLSNDSSTGIWEPTTNLITNGGFESDASGWSGGSGASVAQSTARAKFGTASGLVTWTGTSGQNVQRSIAVTAGLTYTLSDWVYVPSGSPDVQISLAGPALSGQVYSSFTSLKDQWVELTLSATTTSTATITVIPARVGTNTAGKVAYVDGVQLEQKSYATPYVDTNGAAASRGTPRIQAPNSLLTTTQGWTSLRVRTGINTADVTAKSSGEARLFRWNDGTRGVSAYLLGNGNVILSRDHTSGINDSALVNGGAWNPGDLFTFTFAWDASHLYISVNGSSFVMVSNTPTTFGTMQPIDLGGFGTGREFDGDILWAAFGVGTLTNADAATIGSWGNTDPTRASFPIAAQMTMTWDGMSSTGSFK